MLHLEIQQRLNGVTATAPDLGTATNAEKLNGLSASDYAIAGNANFTSTVRLADDGLTVGAANDLKIENGDEGLIENTQVQKLNLRLNHQVV